MHDSKYVLPLTLFPYITPANNFAGQSWWLSVWTGHDQHTASINQLTLHAPIFNMQTPLQSSHVVGTGLNSPPEHGLTYYLGIYVGLSLTVALLGTFRYYYVFLGSIRASRKLFDKLSHTILRTPLRWIDTVPLGRILNRFTGDFNVVDGSLAPDVAQVAVSLLALVGVVAAA